MHGEISHRERNKEGERNEGVWEGRRGRMRIKREGAKEGDSRKKSMEGCEGREEKNEGVWEGDVGRGERKEGERREVGSRGKGEVKRKEGKILGRIEGCG